MCVCVWAANRQMNDKFINRRSSNGFVLRDGHTEKNPGGCKKFCMGREAGIGYFLLFLVLKSFQLWSLEVPWYSLVSEVFFV